MFRRSIALSIATAVVALHVGVVAAGARAHRSSAGPEVFLSLNGAAIHAHWRQSRLRGVLLLQGTDDARLALGLTLTRGARRWTLPGVSAGPGDFEARVSSLPPTLVPGPYRLLVDATTGGAALPEQQFRVEVKAPREGVVDRAWTSAPDGRPLTVVPKTVSSLSWHFHFAAWPARGLGVKATLFGPGEKVSWIPGQIHRPTVVAKLSVRGTTQLKRGSWRLVLSAGGEKATAPSARAGGTPITTVHFTVV